MFGARGVSSVTLGSLPPVLLALVLGRRVSRKSACKDRSSLGSISRFGSARQLDLVYDRDGFRRTCNRASGLLATFTSRTILPVSSTMQMLVSLTDTSNPAKTFTTPIPSVAPLLSREPGGRVRYINFAANVRNIERNQSVRKSGVRESTGDADRHKGNC